MSYQHRFTASATAADLPVGKVVCVGRNFADHAAELNNAVPKSPMLFIKPASAMVELEQGFSLPQGRGSVHFETEMAVLIGERLENASEAQVKAAIAGIGIGLDLTLRDVQSKLKEKGHPWERAKAFDGACPLSAFIAPEQVADLQDVPIRLTVNGETRQEGNSAHMIHPVLPLIAYMSQWFTLEPGDVVLTGTPAGVGPVESGDTLTAELIGLLSVSAQAR